MPIITIASSKGGVGKSTFIINLAVSLTRTKEDVIIIDLDKQITVKSWFSLIDKSTNNDLAKLNVLFSRPEKLLDLITAIQNKNLNSYILIDVPGVDAEEMRLSLTQSDMIITMSSTAAVELWALKDFVLIVNELNAIRAKQQKQIPLLLVFNRIKNDKSRTKVIDEAKTFLSDQEIYFDKILSTVIKIRVAFDRSLGQGKSIFEYKPVDKKAIAEIEQCRQEIMTFYKEL